MKLIPDSNPPNKYNKGLQYVVNALVTIGVASFAVFGVMLVHNYYHEWSDSKIDLPVMGREICYDNVYIDSDYDTSREDQETVSIYAQNYRELGLGGKGIIITNEMLMAMSEEFNLLRPTTDIRGFHLYYANKTTGGGDPSIVFIPLGYDFHEFSPDNYRVLEVPNVVCGPCPILCDDLAGIPMYEL